MPIQTVAASWAGGSVTSTKTRHRSGLSAVERNQLTTRKRANQVGTGEQSLAIGLQVGPGEGDVVSVAANRGRANLRYCARRSDWEGTTVTTDPPLSVHLPPKRCDRSA